MVDHGRAPNAPARQSLFSPTVTSENKEDDRSDNEHTRVPNEIVSKLLDSFEHVAVGGENQIIQQNSSETHLPQHPPTQPSTHTPSQINTPPHTFVDHVNVNNLPDSLLSDHQTHKPNQTLPNTLTDIGPIIQPIQSVTNIYQSQPHSHITPHPGTHTETTLTNTLTPSISTRRVRIMRSRLAIESNTTDIISEVVGKRKNIEEDDIVVSKRPRTSAEVDNLQMESTVGVAMQPRRSQ